MSNLTVPQVGSDSANRIKKASYTRSAAELLPKLSDFDTFTVGK